MSQPTYPVKECPTCGNTAAHYQLEMYAPIQCFTCCERDLRELDAAYGNSESADRRREQDHVAEQWDNLRAAKQEAEREAAEAIPS